MATTTMNKQKLDSAIYLWHDFSSGNSINGNMPRKRAMKVLPQAQWCTVLHSNRLGKHLIVPVDVLKKTLQVCKFLPIPQAEELAFQTITSFPQPQNWEELHLCRACMGGK